MLSKNIVSTWFIRKIMKRTDNLAHRVKLNPTPKPNITPKLNPSSKPDHTPKPNLTP